MAKKSASEKTNVMRVLEQHKIAYTPHEYPHGKEAVDGASVAHLLGQDPAQVFKTLVARGKSGGFHVFVILIDDPMTALFEQKSLACLVFFKARMLVRSRWCMSRNCSA